MIAHPEFRSGKMTTLFIDQTPELFEFSFTRDRGNKTMKYISEITINGFPGIEKQEKPFYESPRVPEDLTDVKVGQTPKNILDNQGADQLSQWVRQQMKYF